MFIELPKNIEYLATSGNSNYFIVMYVLATVFS